MKERLKDLTAVALVGGGIVGMMYPREHCMRWRVGPAGFRRMIDTFVAHPQLTRMLAVVETGFGIWLAAGDRD
jgi:hypothetical protein